MTALAYDSWTEPTLLSMCNQPPAPRVRAVHRVSSFVGVLDTLVRLLCPLLATAAVFFAALLWPAPADPPAHSTDATATTPIAVRLPPR